MMPDSELGLSHHEGATGAAFTITPRSATPPTVSRCSSVRAMKEARAWTHGSTPAAIRTTQCPYQHLACACLWPRRVHGSLIKHPCNELREAHRAVNAVKWRLCASYSEPRAVGPLAREAVAWVAVDDVQLEAGGRDVLQVAIRRSSVWRSTRPWTG